MARKSTDFDRSDTESPRVRSTAELNAPAAEPSDLLSVWQGHTRGLAEQPVPEREGDADALFAQLRMIADDLAQPASSDSPRLLGSGDTGAPTDSAFSTERAAPSDYEDVYPAPHVDLSLLREYIDSAERRLASIIANSQRLVEDGLRESRDRMAEILSVQQPVGSEPSHAPADPSALTVAIAEMEARLSKRMGETISSTITASQESLAAELRGWHGRLTSAVESNHAPVEVGLVALLESLETAERRLLGKLSEREEQAAEGQRHLIDELRASSANHEALLQVVRAEVAVAGDAVRKLEGEVSRFPALFHELRTDLEVSEAELLAAAAREEQVRTDAATREREAREVESAAALQRAIGMLSVLESLDEVVAGLQGRSDSESLKRLQHFERETRAMARLVELEDIPAEGSIDPERHEIVSTVRGSAAPGTILDLLQRGYSFRGRVVRPAQVIAAE